MSIVGRREIHSFMALHADSRQALAAWLTRMAAATWVGPQEVMVEYPRASVVRNGIMVFRIKGNDYRLAARIDFANGVVRIVAVGTHAEYDRWRL
jgi:mRNA interferase HigB